MSKTFLVHFALVAVMTGSAVAQTTTTTRTTDYTFPVIALASTETIGVNLVNLAVNTTNTSSSCTGSVTFAGPAGVIGEATPFALISGGMTSINLPFSSSGLPGPRGLLRVTVETTTSTSAPCTLSYTLNTFDTSSGVTHVFLVVPASSVQPFSAAVH